MKANRILITIAACVLAVSAFAQGGGPQGGPGGPGGRMGGPGGPGGRGGRGPARMLDADVATLKSLSLTGGQQKKVDALKASTKVKLEKAMKAFAPPAGAPAGGGKPGAAGGARPDFQKMRATFQPIRDGYLKGLKGILTKTQYAKYEAWQKEERAKMQQRRGGMGGPGGPGGPGGRMGGPGGGGPGAGGPGAGG